MRWGSNSGEDEWSLGVGRDWVEEAWWTWKWLWSSLKRTFLILLEPLVFLNKFCTLVVVMVRFGDPELESVGWSTVGACPSGSLRLVIRWWMCGGSVGS
ncbi:hypothetical protein WICPIJ_001547 [Wickerhamomyces pijperi]|uniref:Uncharacterized protein n=1 Tax=Wickerhamomyces pijperi TaxID=599730 RepID=A0A9P8TR12_WICPI|nr:hypothetical protein WICPIJ_001547 [Wickerhamomyces pijperi]